MKKSMYSSSSNNNDSNIVAYIIKKVYDKCITVH